jgi:hypothetical protein
MEGNGPSSWYEHRCPEYRNEYSSGIILTMVQTPLVVSHFQVKQMANFRSSILVFILASNCQVHGDWQVKVGRHRPLLKTSSQASPSTPFVVQATDSTAFRAVSLVHCIGTALFETIHGASSGQPRYRRRWVTLESDIVLECFHPANGPIKADLEGLVHTARHGRLDFDRFQKDILHGTNESPLFPAAFLMTGGELRFHGGWERGSWMWASVALSPLRVVAVEALVEALVEAIL